MIVNEREKRICEHFSTRDKSGKVHCSECPLQKGDFKQWDFRCKANSHYDRHTGEWEYDEVSYEDG